MSLQLRHHIVGATSMVPVIGGERPYINLDNAASTPPLKSVWQAVNDFAPWYSSVHRGSGFKSRLSTDKYEEARKIIGEFVGAPHSEYVVIFGKNTTEAINKLAYRLPLRPEDIVVVSSMEHHSNDLPWRSKATVKRIAMTSDGGVDRDDFLALLTTFKNRIKLVALSGASNVTGFTPDIPWFAHHAHAVGAELLIDGAQLAAHRPIDMSAQGIDYLAISGHKMYAPLGTGALIARRKTFSAGTPEYQGGGTVDFVSFKAVDWASTPDRDEAGSPNVVGAVAMAEAAKELQRIGFAAISRHEAALTQYALKRLKEVPGIRVFGGDASERVGVIAFTLANVHSNLVAAILGYEWGIGVRSGCFCAHPYVMKLQNVDAKRQRAIRRHIQDGRRDRLPGMVRISFGLYNEKAEVDLLLQALQAIAKGDYQNYVLALRTGEYFPVRQVQRTSTPVTEVYSRPAD